MVLHQLIDDLTKELNLTPEQQFRVTAKIKRLIHSEKASVYLRYSTYAQGAPVFEGEGRERRVVRHEPAKDERIHKLLWEKYISHDKMSILPDEEIVTWNVGTHKYKQNG